MIEIGPLARSETLADAFALAAVEMHRAEGRLAELVASKVPLIHAVGAYLCESGGKRLRPLLTVLGCQAIGLHGDMSELMCIGELIHLASLLHDDVVDDAPLRRGRPAGHGIYGNAAVILTGDFCLAQAVLLAAKADYRAVKSLATAIMAMAEGEVLQLQQKGNLVTSREEYLEMVDKKSAALIAWCVSIGAQTVGNLDAAEALDQFGRGVGVAFQITDDVLDYGGPTGKAAGQDLRERKVTLPLLLAMERIPGLLARVETSKDADILGLMEEVRACGALDDTMAEARSRIESAVEALNVLAPSAARQALVGLAWFVVERTG